MAGGPLSARSGGGRASTGSLAVSTGSGTSTAGGHSTSALRRTLGRLAQDLGEAQLTWAQQAAGRSQEVGGLSGAAEVVEVASTRARKLHIREERVARLRGLEAAAGCLRRGATHAHASSSSSLPSARHASGRPTGSEDEAANLAEQGAQLRRRADALLARLGEPSRAEDSMALIEEEVTAVRDFASREATRLRSNAEAEAQAELDHVRTEVQLIERLSEEKVVSLSERLAATLRATLLEGAERHSEAAYLRGEQEDARWQGEQMERKLQQLRRRTTEVQKASKEGGQQAETLEAKAKSLLLCRGADEATRRRRVTSQARQREATELWVQQHSQREHAQALAAEAREREQERRSLEHKELHLSEELVSLKAQTDMVESGMLESIRKAAATAEHQEVLATQRVAKRRSSELQSLEAHASSLRDEAHALRTDIGRVENHFKSAQLAITIDEEAKEEEEACIQNELNELADLRCQCSLQRLEASESAGMIEYLKVESEALRSEWLAREDVMAKEQGRRRERLQEEENSRSQMYTRWLEELETFKRCCEEVRVDAARKAHESLQNVKKQRDEAYLTAQAEHSSYEQAERDFAVQAELAQNAHESEVHKTESQLLRLSASLALARQLEADAEVEFCGLQQAHQQQLMHNSTIHGQCKRLFICSTQAQENNWHMVQHNTSLLYEVEAARAKYLDLAEDHANVSEELESSQQDHVAVDEVLNEEQDILMRLRSTLSTLSHELASSRQEVAQQTITPETLLWDEEAIRAESRALTFEVSELEAGLDAAISMQRATPSPRSMGAQRRGGHSPASSRSGSHGRAGTPGSAQRVGKMRS